MLTTALELADSARLIAKQYFRTPLNVETKSDASPVTQADRAIEQALRRMIEERFSDHGIVGEETGKTGAQARFQWVLDPIDGTRPFLSGIPTFTTLIALCDGGVPILGVIDQPILEERWVGMLGNPTSLNGAPCRTSGLARLDRARLSTTSMTYFTEKQQAAFSALSTASASCWNGGDAYAYAMLASGHLDLVVDCGMQSYDFCALRAVVEGAGGVITDWQGAPLTLGSNGTCLAAASPELHAAALAVLKC